mmetsp:Transcript_16946/g.48162  ORF Transcript_16946/g.48162 Transcript_16946/m.48162 type:complete len:527 (-) Transcript_16946:2-1582(-)
MTRGSNSEIDEQSPRSSSASFSVEESNDSDSSRSGTQPQSTSEAASSTFEDATKSADAPRQASPISCFSSPRVSAACANDAHHTTSARSIRDVGSIGSQSDCAIGSNSGTACDEGSSRRTTRPMRSRSANGIASPSHMVAGCLPTMCTDAVVCDGEEPQLGACSVHNSQHVDSSLSTDADRKVFELGSPAGTSPPSVHPDATIPTYSAHAGHNGTVADYVGSADASYANALHHHQSPSAAHGTFHVNCFGPLVCAPDGCEFAEVKGCVGLTAPDLAYSSYVAGPPWSACNRENRDNSDAAAISFPFDPGIDRVALLARSIRGALWRLDSLTSAADALEVVGDRAVDRAAHQAALSDEHTEFVEDVQRLLASCMQPAAEPVAVMAPKLSAELDSTPRSPQESTLVVAAAGPTPPRLLPVQHCGESQHATPASVVPGLASRLPRLPPAPGRATGPLPLTTSGKPTPPLGPTAGKIGTPSKVASPGLLPPPPKIGAQVLFRPYIDEMPAVVPRGSLLALVVGEGPRDNP